MNKELPHAFTSPNYQEIVAVALYLVPHANDSYIVRAVMHALQGKCNPAAVEAEIKRQRSQAESE